MSSSARSQRLSAAVVLAVVVSILSPLVAAGAHQPRAGSGRPGGFVDARSAIAADGTFRGRNGLRGAINPADWRLVSDLATGEAPRLAPASAAATATAPWGPLGSNGSGDGALNDQVHAMAVIGTDLYVGGRFTNAANLPTADYIAKWDGDAWSALGSDGGGDGALNNWVLALAVQGTDLLVGGQFNDAGGAATADSLARWSANTWSGVGSNGAGNGAVTTTINAIAVSGADIYIGGTFTNAATIPEADYVARYSGAWTALGSNGAGNGALNNVVWALTFIGTDLYVGGDFTNAAGLATADRVAKWNGAWSALGSNGAGDGAIANGGAGTVRAFAVDGATLYVGGRFANAAGIAAADKIARWNGSAWSSVGASSVIGATPSVDDLAFAFGELWVGGSFTDLAGIAAADGIARWNGSAWAALGSNGEGNGALIGAVADLEFIGTDLHVGGNLSLVGYPEGDEIAGWNVTPFTDIWNSSFRADIIWVWYEGITAGCTTTLYCPNASVTRGQMASFLARALSLPASATDYFTDDNGSVHEADINRVAKAGITSGCAPSKYCPTNNVTREQMASFLVRALELSAGADVDYFTDDDSSPHEADINRLRHAGLTTGCTATTYCPKALVTRGQMAAFLHRAFE